MFDSIKPLSIHQGLAAISLLSAMAAAVAASSTGSLVVTASILPSCSITGNTMNFGTYSSALLTQSANLSVLCTNGTPYTIALNAGNGSGATTSLRVMTGSLGGTLNYVLYQNSARTSIWGSNTGTDTYSSSGTGASQSIPVYGSIPANQTPIAGVYTDTVLVTLTY